MIEIKIKKSSSSIKKKIQIKKLVRTNTIHAFDAVCGHTKSFYTDSDGIILKKNSRAGMVFNSVFRWISEQITLSEGRTPLYFSRL